MPVEHASDDCSSPAEQKVSLGFANSSGNCRPQTPLWKSCPDVTSHTSGVYHNPVILRFVHLRSGINFAAVNQCEGKVHNGIDACRYRTLSRETLWGFTGQPIFSINVFDSPPRAALHGSSPGRQLTMVARQHYFVRPFDGNPASGFNAWAVVSSINNAEFASAQHRDDWSWPALSWLTRASRENKSSLICISICVARSSVRLWFRAFAALFHE